MNHATSKSSIVVTSRNTGVVTNRSHFIKRLTKRVSLFGATLATVGGAIAASYASADAAVVVWAKVSANGTLIANSDVSSVNHFGHGRYDLFFLSSINGCALNGTVNTNGGSDPGPGSASILLGQVNSTTLFVRTATPSAGAGSTKSVDDDRAFSVEVVCH